MTSLMVIVASAFDAGGLGFIALLMALGGVVGLILFPKGKQ